MDTDDVVDEEHAGRLVGSVSFYFRRNHAMCLPCVWSSVDDLPVVLVFVAVVILPGTITSHRCACCRRACSCCPGSRGPRVDVFLNCTSRLDDDNVVLADCELVEAFVHATFNPATLWQLACRVHRASFCLRFFRFMPANGSVLLCLCCLMRVPASGSCFFPGASSSSSPASSSGPALLLGRT